MLNAYQKRLVCATLTSVAVVLFLYAILLGGDDGDDYSNSSNKQQNHDGALADVASKQKQKASPLLSQPHLINRDTCPRKDPQKSNTNDNDNNENHKPVWLAGYPGSGFDLAAPLIAGFTGMTAVDVYRHHSCRVSLDADGVIPTAACISHYPVVAKDSPVALSVNGELYAPTAVFLLRNPAHAIPSYHTRWWGAQQNQRSSHNHKQPAEREWIDWRNRRFAHHLGMWKRTVLEWSRGMPAAGLDGVGLYVPFEQLIEETTGPDLVAQMAETYYYNSHHAVGEQQQHSYYYQQVLRGEAAACLWHRIAKREAHQQKYPKSYVPSFTALQRIDLLTTLDELIAHFGNLSNDNKNNDNNAKLTDILKGYRTEIETNLRLDE